MANQSHEEPAQRSASTVEKAAVAPPAPDPVMDSVSDAELTTVLLFDRDEHGVALSPPRRQSIKLTPVLARAFVRAARTTPGQDPPLAFGSLLAAMLVDEDDWLKRHFESSGVDFGAVESQHPYRSLVPSPQDAALLASEYLVTTSARGALEEAARIARISTGRQTIDLRHVCAAYPVLPEWHLGDFEKFKIDRLRWARAFGAEMAVRFPGERNYWSSYADRAAPVPLTSFSADVYTEEDLLGIDRGVDALALLVASTRTVTPLAIGIFGPWGSGKTFYMRHLQKRIVRLRRDERGRIAAWKEARAQAKARADDAPLYFDEIAQVEFNAWHYNEANLVASLVEHLFRNLRVTPDEKEDDLDRRRADVLGKLSGLKGELSTIDGTISEARQRLKNAEAGVMQASQAAEQARLVVHNKAGEMASHQAGLEAERERMDLVLRAARLEPDRVAAEDVITVALGPLAPLLRDVRETVTGLKERAFDWAGFFGRLFSAKGLAVVGLCVAAPALLWLAKALEGQWAVLTGSAAAAIAAFGNAIEGLRRQRAEFEAKLKELEAQSGLRVEDARRRLEAEHQQRVAKAQAQIDALQVELDAQRRLLTERESRLVQAAGELATRAAEHDARVAERVQAEQAMRAAQAELDRLSSALLLEEFIKDRASTDEYRKQLGFLALVRRDIERLSQLIDQANRKWLDHCNQDAAPLLNRIVLYIDDLDRCQESTVLAVLEAVHLLLAFPLFVCAVAVDPRWVEKCLRQARRQLFEDTQEVAGERPIGAAALTVADTPVPPAPSMPPASAGLSVEGVPGAPATVADYLEKIFQIPIWMAPIEPRARAGLVNSLLGPTATPLPLRPGDAPEPAAAPSPMPAPVRQSSNAFLTLLEQARESPDPLQVTAEEALYIDELAPLLSDRPRALKRLVNVYRLLKASLPDIERASFVTTAPSSPHKVCLTQLALFTSHPRVAPALLAAIGPDVRLGGGNGAAAPTAQTLQQWFNDQKPPRDAQLGRAIELIPDRSVLQVDAFRRWLPQTSRYLFNRNA